MPTQANARRAVAAVAIGVVFVAVVLSGGEPALVVTVGPVGSPRAEWVEGNPVWVVNDGDDVQVLDAINPHPWWGLAELVGWCESAGQFEAWWDGSKFDAQGLWVFGPASRDLARYPVAERRGDMARIGDIVVSERRSPPQDEQAGHFADLDHVGVDECGGDGGGGPAPRFHPVDGSQRQVFEGAIAAEAGGPSRFCPRDGPAVTCTDDALLVPEFHAGGGDEAFVLAGRFLAKQRGDELHDVIYLPGELPWG